MNFLKIAFVVLCFILSFVLIDSTRKEVQEKKLALKQGKKLKHERIQAAGGTIGFIKAKYVKN